MRRIKKAKVTHLALVKRGANHLPVMYKSAGDGATGTVDIQMMTKAAPDFDERGELLVVAYAPEYRDTQGDIADSQMCKEMGWSFMREGAKLNIRHGNDEVPREKAYVAESFTIQASDERFHGFKDLSGNEVNVAGGWGALIKIDDQELRRRFREDGWNGVSVQGPYSYVEESQDDPVQRALEILRKQANNTNQEDDEMKPEELQAVLDANRTATLAAVGTMLKEALKPAEKTPEEKAAELAKSGEAKPKAEEKPPEFKGDRMKKEDVAEHAKKLKAWQLQKSVDWNDPKDVENYLANLEKADAENGDDDNNEDEAEFRKEDPARRRSAQPTTDPKGRTKIPDGYRDANLNKSEIEGIGCGQRMGSYIQQMNEGKV